MTCGGGGGGGGVSNSGFGVVVGCCAPWDSQNPELPSHRRFLAPQPCCTHPLCILRPWQPRVQQPWQPQVAAVLRRSQLGIARASAVISDNVGNTSGLSTCHFTTTF